MNEEEMYDCGRETNSSGRKETKIISKHFLYSLVSCENVAEVAAYSLGTVESQMIGHDFFSNDISSMHKS